MSCSIERPWQGSLSRGNGRSNGAELMCVADRLWVRCKGQEQPLRNRSAARCAPRRGVTHRLGPLKACEKEDRNAIGARCLADPKSTRKWPEAAWKRPGSVGAATCCAAIRGWLPWLAVVSRERRAKTVLGPLRFCNWKLVGTVLDCGGAQHLISCRKNSGRPATRQRKHARKRALIRT
jgi:hypothetical protein